MRSTGLALAGVLVCASGARATTVAEHYVGVISGGNTTDMLGLFGPKGANLSGKTIDIRSSYVTGDLTKMGVCRSGPPCTYQATQSAAAAKAAVTNRVTVNGRTVTYKPTAYADVFFQDNYQNRLVTETDVFSGQSYTGGVGSQLSVSFKSPVAFGKQLSPGNMPVKGRLDEVSFFTSGSKIAAETLGFTVSSASR